MRFNSHFFKQCSSAFRVLIQFVNRIKVVPEIQTVTDRTYLIQINMYSFGILSLLISTFLIILPEVTCKHRKTTTDSLSQYCWNSNGPSGLVIGHRYQLVFTYQLGVIELQCDDW